MGSAIALNQLFRNLCHHSMWKYAILWKFQDENHMLLTCVDSYAIDTKSSFGLEYAQYKEFIDNHPCIPSFGVESIYQNGSIYGSSIVVAVSTMTRFSYLLGEGIVGKVASMERHQWICVGEMNSELLLQVVCFQPPEELGLQVAAGIKTILFLPVFPLGLVQLGSLDKLSEDLTMVAQLKDLFYAYQYSFDSNSTFEPRMGQIDSYSPLNTPLETYSNCLEINTNLTDLKQTQPFTMPGSATLTFDQAMPNEHLSTVSGHLPRPMAQSYDPFTQVGFHQAHEPATELLDEIRWNAICNELFQDHSEDQIMLNEEVNLDFSFESGLHRGMEQSSLLGWNNNSAWMDCRSKVNHEPETVGCSVEEPRRRLDKNKALYTADKELESRECAKSRCSSSGRCSDSCLTQCKTEDASNSEDSGLETNNMSLENEGYENSASGFWRSCLKKSHGGNRQVRNRDAHRPARRPRDRQLIQDRIRELRELIPSASKCSIDALLDQTVKHMMFLQSIPIHADKLSQSTRPTVPENPASSAPFPLVVENLDQPDQMLVEMQCRNHGLFLDMAQAFKRLGLTILKGILESRLEELWAHFIVEIPKGFHRMDIIWPLMQLLQLKF